MDMCSGLRALLEDKRAEGIMLTKKVYQLHFEGRSNDDIAKECDIPASQVEQILK
jgi:hypothetical protein